MRRAFIPALLLLAAACAALRPTVAHAAGPVHVRYIVYGGVLGLAATLAEINVDLSLGPSAYDVRLSYRTAGMAGMVVTADSGAEATGRFDGAAAVPTRYVSAGVLKGEQRRAEITYQGDTPVVRALVPASEPQRDPVPPAEQVGAIDPMSAMAQLLESVNRTGRCDGHATTFDGRRLIAFTVHTAGMQDLPVTGRSIYAGAALRCDVESRQLAGFKHDADEQRMREPKRSSAWFARLAPDGPLLLVRATFPTSFFGAVTMHLRSASE